MSPEALVRRTHRSSSTSIALVAAVVALTSACAAPSKSGSEEAEAAQPDAAAAPPAAGPAIDLERYRMVDMTHSFTADAPYWPTAGEGFVLKQDSYGMTEGGYFYSSNSFVAPEHGGTHLDAPIHFAEHGWTADQVPLERLITPAVVIDVTAKTATDADYRLTAADVTAWEEKHGQIPQGVAVYLRTGWESRWPDRKSYLGDDTPNDATRLHFPSYGEDAARLLVEQRKVAALGIDTASIDYGPSKDFIVHRVATAANVVGFENVAGLGGLPATGAMTIALPMKIAKGTGGPLRVVGLVPR
jgi:kynurenine formamidase